MYFSNVEIFFVEQCYRDPNLFFKLPYLCCNIHRVLKVVYLIPFWIIFIIGSTARWEKLKLNLRGFSVPISHIFINCGCLDFTFVL